MRTIALILTLCAITSLEISGQDSAPPIINLRNPSFEDIPRNSMPPIGWTDCGFPTETPPDVQPDPVNQFQVTMRPQNGNTYLGMVVRDNDTWESVGQELESPMVGGQCYDFRIHLARSKVYLSQSRVTNQAANYVTPAKIRIHGGYDFCDRVEMIGETETVTNYNWKEYALKLSPSEDFTHIVIEVFWQLPALILYNGNVLLDNASPLVPMNCEDNQLIVMNDPSEDPDPDPIVEPVIGGQQPKGGNTPPPPPAPETVKLGETEAELKVDAVFQIEEITFKANSAELELLSEGALQEIVQFLRHNRGVTVEIGGHANIEAGSTYANEISTSRAKSVVNYLRRHGIASERLFPHGYGKERPVCLERTTACQRRNQRVEVKIIRMEEAGE